MKKIGLTTKNQLPKWNPQNKTKGREIEKEKKEKQRKNEGEQVIALSA